MGPEIVVPFLIERCVDIEVLELSEGKKCRCGDYVDAEDLR